jgi:hypothetical protein
MIKKFQRTQCHQASGRKSIPMKWHVLLFVLCTHMLFNIKPINITYARIIYWFRCKNELFCIIYCVNSILNYCNDWLMHSNLIKIFLTIKTFHITQDLIYIYIYKLSVDTIQYWRDSSANELAISWLSVIDKNDSVMLHIILSNCLFFIFLFVNSLFSSLSDSP